AAIRALSQIYTALERDAVDDDAGVGERPVAGNEARRDRSHDRPAASAPLDQVLVGEQGDRRQRTADALGCVLHGDDAPLLDDLAADPEGLVEHQVDLTLGFRTARYAVELHDHAVLGRVVRDGVADGGRDGLAGRLARHGGVGRRDDRAELDL